MSDVRLASLGLAVAFSASLMMLGCGDSETACAVDPQVDGGSARPDAPPRPDGPVGRETGTTMPNTNGTLGASCDGPTDCVTGLTCLRPTDDMTGGQGPANGMCTRDCTADVGDDGCRPYGGSCVLFNEAPERAYCIETCRQGTASAGKCHGRSDVFCQGLTNQSTGMVVLEACIPSCTDDADCAGRRCDLGSGLCGSSPSTGLPNGSPCMTDLECVGKLCLDASEPGSTRPLGICSGYCRFGGTEGCGYRRSGPVNDTGGACAVGVRTQADGDEGFCVELCDSNADCTLQNPGFGCATDALFVSKWGHGVCLPGGGPRADAGPEASAAEAGRDANGLDAAREATVEAATNPPEAAAPETGAVAPDATAEAAAIDAGADAGAD